jgi:hypothetical protein
VDLAGYAALGAEVATRAGRVPNLSVMPDEEE